MKSSKLLLITLFAIIELALPVAAHSQEQEIIDLIKNYTALNTGDTLRKILKEGISVNATNKNGNSLLMIAALNGDIVTMKYLIRAGADINLWNTKDLFMLYNSPLDYAVFGCQQEAVDLLLAAGADINKKDPMGMSAAMKCGLYKNYEYLLQNLNWILAMFLSIGLILLFCFGKFNKILYKLKKRLEKTSRSESGGFIEAPLLFTTYWTFSPKTYDSMEKFIRDVRYSELTKGLGEEECMKPDHIILQKTSVTINFFNSDIRGDNDLSILITPSNGKNITEAELLFALHHKVIPHLGRLRSDTIQGIILFCESEDGKTAECLALFGEP